MEILDRMLAADLLRQTRRLKANLAFLESTARKLHRHLSPEVSTQDVEMLETPAANLVSTLECLFGGQLRPLLKDLDELETLLSKEVVFEPERWTIPHRGVSTVLKLLRVVRGMSKTHLAREALVGELMLSQYEQGALPGLPILSRIVTALGLPLESIEEAWAFILNIETLRATVEENRE